MLRLLRSLFVSSTFIFLLIGCSEDGDGSGTDLPPEYANLTINGMSNADDVFGNDGANITVGGTFTDDVELASYRVRVMNGVNQTGSDVWEYDMNFPLSGTSQTVSKAILIPVDTRGGLYTLEIRVTDANGSSSDFATFSLIIRNNNTSDIDLTAPATSTMYIPGQTITLQGTVSDNIDIKTVRIVVERIKDETGQPIVGPGIYAQTFFEDAVDDLMWDFEEVEDNSLDIEISNNLTDTGTYGIFISVTDNDDNIAFLRRDVIINVL